MGSILHCLFRTCLEHNGRSDTITAGDEEEEDYDNRAGGGATSSSSPAAAVARRRIAPQRCIRAGSSGSFLEDGSNGVQIDADEDDDCHAIASFSGFHMHHEAVSLNSRGGPSGPGSEFPESSGEQNGQQQQQKNRGFLRKLFRQINVHPDVRPDDSDNTVHGTENLLLRARNGAAHPRYSLGPTFDLASSSTSRSETGSIIGDRPPLIISGGPLRGLMGLVRRSSLVDQGQCCGDGEEKAIIRDNDRSTGTCSSAHLLKEAVDFNFSAGKEYPSISSNEVVMPGSALQLAMANQMSKQIYGVATAGGTDNSGIEAAVGVVDKTDDECVICMDNFSRENPRMPTLCGCGENKTYFHLPCLYQWIEQCPKCPSCRKKLVWEEF